MARLFIALSCALTGYLVSGAVASVSLDGVSDELAAEPRLVPLPDAPSPVDPSAPRYLTRRARMLAPDPDRGDGFSNVEFFSTFGLNMTEAITGSNPGVREIAELMARLHAQQHPQTAPPFATRAEACASARLLVMQYVPESFEGICSILKSLMLGLAQAAWSNRTLVWGLDLSPLQELTRPAWEHSRGLNKTVVHGVPLDCAGAARGGGPYTCFFEPLSSCSLADVTWEELRGLGVSGADDAGRVQLYSGRRGIVAYHPPPGVLPPGTTSPRHKWTAALAGYVFRLKPELHAAFERTRAALAWPAGAAGRDVSCAHVRHGDVHANRDIYHNRRAFPFEEYFAAPRLMPHTPSAVFVASDSPRIGEEIAAEAARDRWAPAPPPRLFAADAASERFRTPHGSHTVAAEGACGRTTGRCILAYTDVVKYQAAFAADPATRPKHERLMRVIFEALEDIHLLSHCARLAVIACSHFSTFGAMLSWVRTGGASAAPGRVAFLDMPFIAEGELQNSFLFNSFNWTDGAYPGALRWRATQERFADGLWPRETWNAMSSADALMHSEEGLPRIPADVLLQEAARWVAPGPVRVWPRECPLPRAESAARFPTLTPDAASIVDHINSGAEHDSAMHVAQALRCWGAAAAALADPAADVSDANRVEWLDVARGNLEAERARQLQPYSQQPAALAALAQTTLRLDGLEARGATLAVPRALRLPLGAPGTSGELVEEWAAGGAGAGAGGRGV